VLHDHPNHNSPQILSKDIAGRVERRIVGSDVAHELWENFTVIVSGVLDSTFARKSLSSLLLDSSSLQGVCLSHGV